MKYSNALLGLYACILSLTFNNAFSQCGTNCTVACNGQINVSLGVGCQTLFTPSMGGKNVTASNAHCYTAEVYDHHNQTVAGNLLTTDYLNQLLTYKITETECNNYCWGTVLVEYKLGPQLVCPDDMTVNCSALPYLELPIPDDLCAAVSMTLVDEKYTNLNCDVDHQAMIIRSYRAVDEYGNSTTCSHDIFLKRLPLLDIVFPAKTIVSCSDPFIEYDADGFPLPWVYQSVTDSLSRYGVPFICQQDVVTDLKCPYTGTYGTVTGSSTGSGAGAYTYSADTTFFGVPLFPDGGGRITIETGDTLAPFNSYVFDNKKGSHHCGAAVVYNDIEISSAKTKCKRKIFRNWEVIEWWCSQELLVSSTQIIEIVDDVVPTITCPADQTVNSTLDCYADMNLPSAFVQDACSPDIEVEVSFDGQIVKGNGAPGKLIQGTTLLTYKAIDACGNTATCETNVTVIDYATPVALCEDGKIVSLANGDYTKVPAYVFDNGSYDDCSIEKIEVRRIDDSCHPEAGDWSESAYFCCADATVPEVLLEFRVTDGSGNYGACQVNVVVQDKGIPNMSCPPNMTVNCKVLYDYSNLGLVFGYGSIAANCASSVPSEIYTEEFNQCGVGTLTRTFQALDISGNVAASCDQVITIFNDDPFTADDIEWPKDLVLTDRCEVDGLDPENLEEGFGFPTYNQDKCALVGFDYEDEIYNYSSQGNGECVTISRTWSAINWCGEIDDFDRYYMPVPQLIKVRNTVAPEIDNAGDVVFETVNDCNSGAVNITRTATDDCTGAFRWSYTITDFNLTDTLGSGVTNVLDGKLAIGNYFVHWEVSDKCGNNAYHRQAVSVISKKAPTPVCHNSIAASLAGVDIDGNGTIDNELVTLWASDFDAGSYPACNGELAFSLSSDLTDRNIVFDCSDLGIQRVEMWVTDVVTGAQDFCVASIEIQDAGLCPDGERALLSGAVRTESADMVPAVEIALRGTNSMSLTDNEGSYAFGSMPLGGAYIVEPSLNTNYLNGVSTLDLIKMQRHILGLDLLDSPYQMIAADVNSSGSINGIDLVELRKLILGIYEELPNNESWRFVSADYNFPDRANPWLERWEENYSIGILNNDMIIDFVGVKIGDVNNSADLSTTGKRTAASGDIVSLGFEQEDLTKGDMTSIIVSTADYERIAGLQGTLEFDSDKIEIITVNNLGLNVQEGVNFNKSSQEEGWMTFSYFDETSSTSATAELFEIVVRAKVDLSDSENLFSVTSGITLAEAYDPSLQRIQLLSNAQNTIAKAEIISVNPNPWISLADIKIRMPRTGNCDLDFIDVNGRLVYHTSQQLSAGINAVSVNRQDIPTSGLVYIRMTVGGESSEYKMMVY